MQRYHRLDIMNINQSQRKKWISDAAYFKSLGRIPKPGLDIQDWLEAEQEFRELMNKRVKTGLVSINAVYPVDS